VQRSDNNIHLNMLNNSYNDKFEHVQWRRAVNDRFARG
jgi:hypothetical protein